MYLLYLDGSGFGQDPAECHFVLAAVSVFERRINHLTLLQTGADSLGLGQPADVELHASVIALERHRVRRRRREGCCAAGPRSRRAGFEGICNEGTLQGLAAASESTGRDGAVYATWPKHRCSWTPVQLGLCSLPTCWHGPFGDATNALTRGSSTRWSTVDKPRGIRHGLVLFERSATECMCPACLSRQNQT